MIFQIQDHNIVSFLPLDVTDEDSVNSALSHIDNAMQYGEDEEPKMPDDMDGGNEKTPSSIFPFIDHFFVCL